MAFDKISGLISNIGSSLKNNYVKTTPNTQTNYIRVKSSAPSIPKASFSSNVAAKFTQGLDQFKKAKADAQNQIKLKAFDLAKQLDRDPAKSGFQLFKPVEKTAIRSAVESTPLGTPLRVYDATKKYLPTKQNLKDVAKGFLQEDQRARQAGQRQPFILDPRNLRGAVESGEFLQQKAPTPLKVPLSVGTEFIRNYETGFNDLSGGIREGDLGKTVSGAYKTVAPSVALAGGVPRVLFNMGFSGILGAGGAALSGEDPSKGFGAGATDALRFSAITRFTDPITSKFISQIGGNFLQQQIGKRAVAAVGNVIEDEIISRIDNKDVNNVQRIWSAVIGAALGGNDDVVESIRQRLSNSGVRDVDGLIQKTKDQLSNAIKNSEIVRLTINDNGNVETRVVAKSEFDAAKQELDAQGVQYEAENLGPISGQVDFSAKIGGDVKETEIPKAPEYKSKAEEVKVKQDYAYKTLAESQTVEEAAFNLESLVNDARFGGTPTDFQALKKAVAEYKKMVVTGPGMPRNPEYDSIFQRIDDILATKIKDFQRVPVTEGVDQTGLPTGETLKHFTTPEAASKLRSGEPFDFSQTPQHGTGSKDFSEKTGRFVSDGEPTLYLSRDDVAWGTSLKPNEKAELVDISKMGPDEVMEFQRNGGTVSFNYETQEWEGRKNAFTKSQLEGVDYVISPNARVLKIDSPERLSEVIKESGYHADDPAFWSYLRSKYDVVDLVNVKESAMVDEGVNKTAKRFFSAAKADQAIVLNPSVVSVKQPDGSGLPASEVRALGSAQPEQELPTIQEQIKQEPPQATVTPQQAKAEAEALSPTGQVEDIVKATEPTTDKEVVQQELKSFLEQSEAQRQQPLEVPKTDPEVEKLVAEADKRVLGESTPAVVDMPMDIASDKKMRKTYLSMMESPVYNPTYRETIKNAPERFYIPTTENERVAESVRFINEQGAYNVAADIINNGIDLNDPQSLYNAVTVHQFLTDAGENKLAKSLASQLFLSGTSAGQGINAYKLLDYASPTMIQKYATDYIEGGLQTTGATGKILDAILPKSKSRLADTTKTYDEAKGFLSSVNKRLGNIEGDQAKIDFIKEEINKNKKLSNGIKDKDGFANKIIKSFDGETKTDQISVDYEKETGIKLNDKEVAQYIDRARVADSVADPKQKQAQLDQLNGDLASRGTKKESVKQKDLIDKLVEIGKDRHSSLFPEVFDAEVKEALLKELSLPFVDSKFSNYVVDEAARIKTLEGEEARNKATRELFKKINEKIPLSLQEVHRAYIFNNVLSGLGTHLRNGWENQITAWLQTPLDLFSSNILGGNIKGAIAEPAIYLKELASQYPSGFSGAKAAIKGEIYPEKFTLSGERSQTLPQYLTLSGRMLEASDQLTFKPMREAMYKVNISKGMTPEEAIKQADIDASEALYKGGYDPKNKTGQGLLLSWVDSHGLAAENTLRSFGMDYFVMFPRIAIKLAKTRFEYSPFGFSTLVGGEGVAKKNPRLQATKALAGTAMMIAGFVSRMTDHARGQAPTDKEERTQYYEEGPEWTQDFAGFNVPIKYIGKTDMSWKIGVWLADTFIIDNPALVDKSTMEKIAVAGFGLTSMMADETYLSDITSYLDTLNDIVQGDTYSINKMIGQSFEKEIPFSGLAAWVNKAFIDPIKRKGGGIAETMLRRMPIFSQGAEPYLTSEGEEADIGYGDKILRMLNPFLPYDISKQREDLRESINESRQDRYERKVEKQEEKDLEPDFWDRLREKAFGVSAAEDLPSTQLPGEIKTKTTPGLEEVSPETEKKSWFSNWFGKKDKTVEKTYNVGELVTENTDDRFDLYQMPKDATFKVPKEQDAFNMKYKEVAGFLDKYDDKVNELLFDDTTKQKDKKDKLKELDEQKIFYDAAFKVMEEKYPEQVFEGQLKTYGRGSDAGVEKRGDWAVTQLNKLIGGDPDKIGISDEWKNAVNKMWESGVLTSGSGKTLEYILDNNPDLTKEDFKYTGDNERVKKTANSATGSGKKFKAISYDVPAAVKFSASNPFQIEVPEAPSFGSGFVPIRSLSQDAPSLDYTRLKAPEMKIPELQVNKLKVRGL